jgi:ribosomal protein S18 acetylase RimI-like enzyme
MELSLLDRTVVFVNRPQTVFEDHGTYGVLRTPAGPSYYSGNLLILGEPLVPARLAEWAAVFHDAFDGSEVRHFRLEWTGPPPTTEERAAYAAAGYEVTTIRCMTTQAAAPVERLNPALEIRPLREADQGRLKRFLLDTNPDWSAPFMDFMTASIFLRQQVLEGGWWLGWLDGRIAGSMGLFFDGPLGRFQAVDTHPAFRRRGVARTMVAHLTRHGFDRPQTEQLVIVADRDYFAVRLYEQCGYRTLHPQYELFKPPPAE